MSKLRLKDYLFCIAFVFCPVIVSPTSAISNQSAISLAREDYPIVTPIEVYPSEGYPSVTPIQEPNVEIVGAHSTNQFFTSSAGELRQPPNVGSGMPPVPTNNSLAYQEEKNKYDAWELTHRKNTLRLHLYSSIAILILVVVIVIAGIFLSYEQLRKGSSSETKFSVKGGAVEISSSIIGFLILFLSLAFFYLYLKEVYPVHEIGAAKDNAGLTDEN